MADGFSYGGYTGLPKAYWICPPYPSVSTPLFLATPPSTSSYDQTFDPMIPHSSYHQSPSYGDNSRSPTPPSSSSYAQSGNLGHGVEDSRKDTSSSSQGGYYPSMETPSSGVVYCPPMERQRVPPYSSATVSSLADMLIRNSQEPFYVPIPPSGVCATTSAFDLNYAAASGPPYLRVPYMPFNTQASFGGNQAGFRLGEGRSFGDNVSSHPPVFIQTGGYVEPVFGYGEASTGHVEPLSENPVGSRSPRYDAKSSLYQRPDTLVADSGNGVSGSSSKNAIGDLNFDEQHESWNHCMVASEGPLAPESCGAVKADNRNAARSAVSYETHSEGSANQPSEDVQAKTCKLQGQYDKKSPACDQGDFTSPGSSTRVSSVVNAMHDLSEVLVYECFSYRRSLLLKPEQLEKIVENLTKCLKKITGDETIAGEASVPTQVIHVSCPNVVDLNEAPSVVSKDCQGFNIKPVDSLGFKESVDKDEMTKSIKNMLASNFPDGEENHPQTLLYKNLWLETEAALCSTTYLARYHRIKNETGNLKLQNREISADASTLVQETFTGHRESFSIMKKVEQETAEALIKDGSTFGNNVVPMSHDAPQSSRFNTAPVEAVLSLMSPASNTEENHNDVIDRFQILKDQETKRKLKSQNCSDPEVVVIDRFQILEHQETMRKLKSQDFSETRMDEQEEHNPPDASEMAPIGRSSHMSDVMGRFQMLKRREAEQVQKSLNSVDFDSDSDSDFESDSDSDQPRNRTQRCDYLWSGPMMTIGGNSQIEMCANTEPSADGKGYESPTSDWEHVLKDD